MNLLNRFLNYTKVDTRSSEDNQNTPSSKGQWELAHILEAEMKTLGLENVYVNEYCFVFGTLAKRVNSKNNKPPIIGLMAHLDTYPGFSSENVQPQVHKNYQGEDILLNESEQIYLSPKSFPDLLKYIGDDIVTTDGKTLLGADDKAGIAEILTAVEYLIKHPEIEHGELRIVFTPDEEIDRGGLNVLDVNDLNVDFVITMDGDGVGEVNFENFNAAHAVVKFQGCSVHTGEAKNRMVNAVKMAYEWAIQLPQEECPENTDGYQGFFHIEELGGDVNQAQLYCLIRDFDEEGFESRKEVVRQITQKLSEKYGNERIKLTLQDDYKNMKSVIMQNPEMMESILKGIEKSGIKPRVMPIRGGTDGASLAEKGIKAPNVFLGGHNYHGEYEFISVQAMQAASNALVNIIEIFALSK